MWRWGVIVPAIVAAVVWVSTSAAQTMPYQVHLPSVAKNAEPMLVGEPMPGPPATPPTWATRTPTPTATPRPVATPAPAGSLTLLSTHHSQYDSLGYLYVTGEVRNDTGRWLDFVKVVVDLFDQSGQIYDTNYSYPYGLKTMPPGALACFSVSLSRARNPAWSRYAIAFESRPAQPETVPRLSVVGASGTYNPQNRTYLLVGQVRNDDTRPVESVEVMITMYDAVGRVLGCRRPDTSLTRLAPGQTTSFRTSSDAPNVNQIDRNRFEPLATLE